MVQEKFRRFEDRGTGIMPFEPLQPKKRPAYVHAVLCSIGTVFLAIRIPLLALLYALHLLLTGLLIVVPIAIVRRPLDVLITAFTARFALLLMGFWWIPASECHLPGRRKSSKPSSLVGSGSLLIANHLGYVEILYLQFRYCPVFALVVDGGDKAGLVVPVDCITAMKATNPFFELDTSKAKPLNAVLAQAKKSLQGPVVVFPESVTSNGLAILPFLPPISGLETSDIVDRRNVHVIAFKHGWSRFSPSFVVGDSTMHVVTLLMQFYNNLQVLRLPSSDIPVFSTKTDDDDSTPTASSDAAAADWCERLRKTMASMLGVKCVSVGADTKRDFARAWETDRHGQAPAAAAAASSKKD